jgi:23S rRNA (cytosine1962-C5)-methyltransferase
VLPNWLDYTLLDSGNGLKLEQFGLYRFVRPEVQAAWRPALTHKVWESAHGEFKAESKSDQGAWHFRQPVETRWVMQYRTVKFWVKPTPFRHLGVFPEQAMHWDWLHGLIAGAGRPVKVLNLFAYTGVATLFAAAAGASVTHVDASKPVITWARENQTLSGLSSYPIRWIVEDAVKYVEREVKRDVRYDGFILDPPVFGHGPKGEVWQLSKSLPRLLDGCRSLVSDTPLFVMLTVYTPQSDLPHLATAVGAMMAGHSGSIATGKAVLVEKSAGRVLEPAMFARWQAA